MFKITVDLRRAHSGDDYTVHSFQSANNDVQEHMMWLQQKGYEVLNIRSEPFADEADNDLQTGTEFFMTFINCKGKHKEDSDG